MGLQTIPLSLPKALRTSAPPAHVNVDLGVFSFDDPHCLGIDDLDELGILPDRRRPVFDNVTPLEMME